jgi:hypothetical protein
VQLIDLAQKKKKEKGKKKRKNQKKEEERKKRKENEGDEGEEKGGRFSAARHKTEPGADRGFSDDHRHRRVSVVVSCPGVPRSLVLANATPGPEITRPGHPGWRNQCIQDVQCRL